MEGPYTGGSPVMDTILWSYGYLPTTSPYNGDLRVVDPIPADTVDWVYVQLRDSYNGNAVTGRSAFLRDDGMLVDDDGTSPVKMNYGTVGDYYIVVNNRDHLALMTTNTVSLNQATSTLYDFTTAQSQAYGTNSMKEMTPAAPTGTPTPVYGMVGGDAAIVFGIVDSADRVAIWNDNTYTGYFYTDVTFTGAVDAGDRVLCWNDRGRISQVPNPGDIPSELLDEIATDSTSVWSIRNQVASGSKFSFDVVVDFTGTPLDFKVGAFSLRVLYDAAELSNPTVPTGLSSFYKELWPGQVDQWDTLGYFHVTETTAGDDSALLIDLDMALLQGAYSTQGYTESLLALGSADGGQLLCRVEFDVKSPDTFIPAAAGLAWDDELMGDGHFSSSVAMKKVDERGEMVTNGASFKVEVGVAPTPEPTNTPDPGVTPSPEPAPTPPALDIQVGEVKAGESFDLILQLNESITSPFDLYLFAEVMGKYYTISLNGAVQAGITPLYRNVPGFAAPYSTTIRPKQALPLTLGGSKLVVHAVAVEAGKKPVVSSVSELTAESANVILLDREEANIN
jgi:hypothetical protein